MNAGRIGADEANHQPGDRHPAGDLAGRDEGRLHQRSPGGRRFGHLRDGYRRRRRHSADLRRRHRARSRPGRLTARRSLTRQQHRAVRDLRRRRGRRHSRGRDQHAGRREQCCLVAGRHSARLHVDAGRQRRDLPRSTRTEWRLGDAADEQSARRPRIRTGRRTGRSSRSSATGPGSVLRVGVDDRMQSDGLGAGRISRTRRSSTLTPPGRRMGRASRSSATSSGRTSTPLRRLPTGLARSG